MVTRTGVLGQRRLVDITIPEVGALLSAELGTTVCRQRRHLCRRASGSQAPREWTTDGDAGTGIGVAGGALIRGANGFTGEIGHMVVDPDGPPCPCGRRGCWERYASGSGLARLAREAAVGRRLERVVSLAGGDAEKVRGEDVQAAAREGDSDALEVSDSFGRWVALGLANLTNILDPESFVLGGGLAASADLYLGPIQKWFTQLLYAPHLRPHPTLMFAQLGERAGAVGAALLAVVH